MTFDDLGWVTGDHFAGGERIGAWLVEGNCDDVVRYYEDGTEVDKILDVLRVLATVTDEELSLAAQERLEYMLAARARYRS